MRTSEIDREWPAHDVAAPGSRHQADSRTHQFIALVQGLEGVRYVALADSLDSLWIRLCTHVRAWAPYQLDEDMCDRVLNALDAGQMEAAVRLYFTNAGRWEPEELLLRALAPDGTAEFQS